LLRVAVPYAVWTLFGILERRPHGIGAWLRTIFLGQGYYGQLYFVPLIMQLYLLSPLVYRAIAHRYRRCTVAGLMVAQALLVVLYQLTYLHIVGLPTTVQAALDAYVQPLFPVWIGYWALGMFLGLSYSHFARWVSSLRPAPLAVAWAAAACWVLADVYWSIGITGTPISQATNFFRISVVVFSLVSMLAFFRWTLSDWHGTRRRGPFGKALQLLGQHSFGVYLVHIFVQRRLQAISWTAGLFNTWYGCTLAIALILLLSLGLSVLLSRLRWGWLLVGTSTRGQYERTRPAVGSRLRDDLEPARAGTPVYPSFTAHSLSSLVPCADEKGHGLPCPLKMTSYIPCLGFLARERTCSSLEPKRKTGKGQGRQRAWPCGVWP